MSDARVEVVAIDRLTTATLVECDRAQLHISKKGRDGKVPWDTAILPILRGNTVTVDRLYRSIQIRYGEESISRMRVYNYLNSLVQQKIATKEECVGEDEYTILKKE
jgi:hypothetical protein